MKKVYVFTLLSISLNSHAQNCNIGNESATGSFTDGNFSPNYLLGVKHTLSQIGTLNSINLIGNNTGYGVQMAVYDDNGGTPNNLIAASSPSTVGNGITTLPVNPVVLSPGDYWIMAVYQTGGNSSDINLNATGNVVYYSSVQFGSAIPTNASGFTNFTGQDFLYFLDIDCGNTLCQPNTGTDTQTACNSYTWIDGNNYTTSNNTATHTLTNVAGCDSVVSLDLTIINSATGTDTRTECYSYTWIDGINYTSSNNTATYNIVGGAINGCDSLVTLNLTINDISDLTTSISGVTISANNSDAIYQWLDCDNNYALINSETNQSFTATANGNYAVALSANGCLDTTECVNINSLGLIENNFGTELSVYPNPTKGIFSIDLGDFYESITVSITDLSGKLIDSKTAVQSEIIKFSLEEPAGIYTATIHADKKKAHIKLIKE